MPKVLKTSNHAKTWLSLGQSDISWFEVKLKMISNHTTQSLRVAYFPSKACISRVEVHLIDTSNRSFHCTVRWVIISLDLWAVIPSGHASGRARVYSSSVRWPLSTYIRGLGGHPVPYLSWQNGLETMRTTHSKVRFYEAVAALWLRP
jgi:hypothetical protein